MNYSLSTFNAPNGVRLDQYDGELNADWQRPYTGSYPNLCRIYSERVHRTNENPEIGTPSSNGAEHFLSNYTIPSASYVVEANFWNMGVFSEWNEGAVNTIPPPPDTVHPNGTITNTSEGYIRSESVAQIGGRATTGTFNGYIVAYAQLNATWYLRKISGGVVAIERTYFDIIPFNQSRLVQLVLRGYWVEMWIDGVMRKSFRDEGVGAFSNAGLAMLRFDSGPDNWALNEFATKGIHIDNFRVHDEFPPLPINEEMVLHGSGNSSGQVSLNWTE